ncbi:MAG: preprotein translocase subunit SecG [Ignavibacteriae bacterium]|nr:MAG: preprotein translocase subunit SecG [Ignavibacteriota bacterium]
MYTILITISIIVSFLLVIIVLLQASKGDGLSGTIGGSAGGFGTVFGARRTADFLSKATWWLGGTLLVLALIINLFFLPGQSTKGERESIIQSSQPTVPQTTTLPPPVNSGENSGKTETSTSEEK